MRFFAFFFLFVCCFAEEKIFFLHIPKSGGITFRSILEDHYYLQDQFVKTNWFKLNPAAKEFQKAKLISGHFPYSQIKNFVEDFKKVTFLRDPVTRILSEHRYLFDRDHKKTRSEVLQEHFLPQEGDPIDTASNVMCKLLSQLPCFDPTIPIEAHLASAKETLAHEFDFVGITEQMEESVALFCSLLGWTPPEETPIHNTTNTGRANDPQPLLDEIAERNWADIELYQFAKELFEAEKKQILTSVKEETIQWVDQIDYNFEKPLDGFGWCPREKWPEGTFRWLCSPEKGTIYFPLIADSDYSFKAKLYIKPSLVQFLSVSVNGTFLTFRTKPAKLSQNEYEWIICTTKIPKSLLQNRRKTRIEIAIHDPTYTPSRDSYRGRCGSKKISIRKI